MLSDEMERGGLLDVLKEEEESKSESNGSLSQLTSEALANPRVRAMLAAFREGGPSRLAQFIGDPECNAALEVLRGPAQLVTAKPRVLLGVTGSVAAIKVPELVSKLERIGEVKIAATSRGAYFLDKARASDSHSARLRLEPDEWESWQRMGDPVGHVELRKWADIYVVAPASANALAKFANGLCDDLVTCVARAWDLNKPFIIAPAMNTYMWSHPITRTHLDTLTAWGAIILNPVAKTLACGDKGVGGLASVDDIISTVASQLIRPR